MPRIILVNFPGTNILVLFLVTKFVLFFVANNSTTCLFCPIMGDAACLKQHAFSYSSALPIEAKQGKLMHALGESISLGRFTSESLAWDKWSTFSHKRYVEEAERYAQPGSVAQKKAFFEAHFKKIAAQKAAALLEQDNTQEEANAQITNNSSTDGVVNVKETENATPLTHVASEKEPLHETQETISRSELSETSHTEKPLLKVKSSTSKQDGDDDDASVTSKRRSALSRFKSSVHSIKSKFPPSPSRHNIPRHANKENNLTSISQNSTSVFTNEKRSTANSLSKLMNFTPAKEPDRIPPSPANLKKESSKAKKCITPLRTAMVTSDGATKRPMTTPSSENRRMETPIHPSASGSKTPGPKWNTLSAFCSKSFTACRNKLQSPTLSTPFLLRTEERAARRKQKLEEKFNEKEVEKVQRQTKLKEKAEMELKKLRRSFCFKARPLPEFYKERETESNHTKKIPVRRSRSPKHGKKPNSSTMKDMVSQPPITYSTKNGSYKNSGKKKTSKPIDVHTLPMVVSHENASPNIQHFGVSSN